MVIENHLDHTQIAMRLIRIREVNRGVKRVGLLAALSTRSDVPLGPGEALVEEEVCDFSNRVDAPSANRVRDGKSNGPGNEFLVIPRARHAAEATLASWPGAT